LAGSLSYSVPRNLKRMELKRQRKMKFILIFITLLTSCDSLHDSSENNNPNTIPSVNTTDINQSGKAYDSIENNEYVTRMFENARGIILSGFELKRAEDYIDQALERPHEPKYDSLAKKMKERIELSQFSDKRVSRYRIFDGGCIYAGISNIKKNADFQTVVTVSIGNRTTNDIVAIRFDVNFNGPYNITDTNCIFKFQLPIDIPANDSINFPLTGFDNPPANITSDNVQELCSPNPILEIFEVIFKNGSSYQYPYYLSEEVIKKLTAKNPNWNK